MIFEPLCTDIPYCMYFMFNFPLLASQFNNEMCFAWILSRLYWLFIAKNGLHAVGAAYKLWSDERMMVHFKLMLVKCSWMMVKWVKDHILISPLLTSISPSLTSILVALAWSYTILPSSDHHLEAVPTAMDSMEILQRLFKATTCTAYINLNVFKIVMTIVGNIK